MTTLAARDQPRFAPHRLLLPDTHTTQIHRRTAYSGQISPADKGFETLEETIEALKSDLAFYLYSPPFTITAPKVANASLIPDDAHRAMHASWCKPLHGERSIQAHIIHDAYVVEEGLVFTSDGTLVRETVTQHSALEVERGRKAVYIAKQAGLVGLDGHHVLCRKRGESNYGHWLLEMLPKAFFSELCHPVRELKFIVPIVDGQLSAVIQRSLELVGIDQAYVVPAGRQVTRVSELTILDGLTNHGVFMSPLVMQCTDVITSRVRAGADRKIYVTRNSASSRRFVNEQEVCARAIEKGYRPLDPATLSFDEQVAVFKGATDIVGVMGAALSNIAFSPRGSRVVNLAPATMPDTFFWFISGLKGHSYEEIRCSQSGPIRAVADWDTDLLITDQDLDAAFMSG